MTHRRRHAWGKRTTLLALAVLMLAPTACRRGPKGPIAPNPPNWIEAKVDAQAMEEEDGIGRIGPVYFGVAQQEGDFQEWTIQLAGDQCYWFSGIGDENVRELYLALYNQEDDRVESEKDDKGALMKFCPDDDEGGTYRLQGKVDEGRGHYGIGIFTEGGAGAPMVAGEGPPGPAMGPAGVADTNLAAACDAYAAQVASGATRAKPHVGAVGSGVEVAEDLKPGSCYWFVAVGKGGISGLKLDLFDAEGREVTSKSFDAPRGAFEHCAAVEETFRLVVTPTGSGEIAVGVYEKAATMAKLQ